MYILIHVSKYLAERDRNWKLRKTTVNLITELTIFNIILLGKM